MSNISDFYGTSSSAIPTGVKLPYDGTTAPTGWILLTGASAIRTLGNASSGADRANADTEELFELIWNSMADAQAAVSSGRGASASADYAANKTITLPDPTGRVLMAVDPTGTLLTQYSPVLGQVNGSEKHPLSEAELALHSHTGAMLRGTTAYYMSTGFVAGANGEVGLGNNNVGNAGTDTAGSDTAHNNMQPWLGVHIIQKL